MASVNGITVKLPGWMKYNGRADVKKCTWLRIENQISSSESLYGLTAAERFVFVEIACTASRKQSDTFRINVPFLADRAKAAVQDVESAVGKLLANGTIVKCISTDLDESDGSGPYVPDETYETRRTNETNQTNVSLASASDDAPARARVVPEKKAPKRKPKPAESEEIIERRRKVWDAFSEAYLQRHGTEPVRNKEVNIAMKRFTEKISLDEAAEVAAFYVKHNDYLYVKNLHPVTLLVRDAEKLRTEWATGRQITSVEARHAERKQANFNVFDKLIREAEEKEAGHG